MGRSAPMMQGAHDGGPPAVLPEGCSAAVANAEYLKATMKKRAAAALAKAREESLITHSHWEAGHKGSSLPDVTRRTPRTFKRQRVPRGAGFMRQLDPHLGMHTVHQSVSEELVEALREGYNRNRLPR